MALRQSPLWLQLREDLRNFQFDNGTVKVDWALDGPIPWKAEGCRRAATVHLGPTIEEIAEGEAAVWRGVHPERPFVLIAQQSIFDSTRAPAGKQTGWAYVHVPHGSDVDMTERIEAQVERFAPGFRDRILARHVLGPADLERRDANLVEGDNAGGTNQLHQQLVFRPLPGLGRPTTPIRGLYLASASAHPGGGVHGACGTNAARAALATHRLRRMVPGRSAG